MSRKTKIIVGIAALLVVGGAVAYFTLGSKGSGPEIDTAKVTRQRLDVTVSASGDVAAGVYADVFVPAPSTIDQIFVTDGDTVKAGDRIATIDDGQLALAVSQAKAALASARAQAANAGATAPSAKDVAAAKAGVSAANSQLTAAKAGLSAARVAADAATDAYDAARLVLPSDSPTLTALYTSKKQADAGVASAKAGVKSAEAGVRSAEAALSKATSADPASTKSAASAGVAAAQKAYAEALSSLDKATLVSPIDGVVVFNAMSASLTGDGDKPAEGSSVTPAVAPFTVVDLSALRFDAEVDEADIDRVKAGLAADVTLDAFAGTTFATTVARVDPAAKTTSTGGTVFVAQIPLTDLDKQVLLGMKGDATIKVSSTGEAVTIPVEALFSEGGTDYVYVVDAGKLQKTEITAGATTDTDVEVASGLAPGQVVALSGSTQYTDGMSVRVKGQ